MASAAALGSHLSGGRINLAHVREVARSDFKDCMANCPNNKVKTRHLRFSRVDKFRVCAIVFAVANIG